jgi:diguanylate cyclase (GGDEF)-like protein
MDGVRLREGGRNKPALLRDNERIARLNEELKLADLVGRIGVINRNAENMRLLTLAERLKRNSKSEPNFTGFIVGFVDLDKLKAINDFGGKGANHKIGNEAIVNLARGLVGAFRHWEDAVVRIGGDEFAFFIPVNHENVQSIMEGESGRIKHAHDLVNKGVHEIEITHVGNWPGKVDGVNPGTMSLGYGYVTREQFAHEYEQYLQDDDPTKGDFLERIVFGADTEMYAKKHD